MNYLDPQAFCSCPQIRIGEGSPFETWDSPGWTDVEEPSLPAQKVQRVLTVADQMHLVPRTIPGRTFRCLCRDQGISRVVLHYGGAGFPVSIRRLTQEATWLRERNPSLAKMFSTCPSAVRWAITSSPAMSRLVKPRPMSSAT